MLKHTQLQLCVVCTGAVLRIVHRYCTTQPARMLSCRFGCQTLASSSRYARPSLQRTAKELVKVLGVEELENLGRVRFSFLLYKLHCLRYCFSASMLFACLRFRGRVRHFICDALCCTSTSAQKPRIETSSCIVIVYLHVWLPVELCAVAEKVCWYRTCCTGPTSHALPSRRSWT